MDESFSFIDDYQGVMERLGGNTALLRKLLVKFRDSYRDTRVELVHMIREGRYEEAHRLVHTIKGVSGNLGIGTVYHTAVILDGHLKAGDSLTVEAETSDFLDSLESVFNVLAL